MNTYQEKLKEILNGYKAWLIGASTSEKEWLTIDEALDAINALNAEAIEQAETIGRVKELEAGNIHSDWALQEAEELFIQGVKVPRYIAQQISNAAKVRRTELLRQREVEP